MRIVLVDNLLFETKGGERCFDLQPHLGLISLLAAVEGEGHRGILFDPKLEVSQGRVSFDESLYRHLAAALVQLDPDVVGFTTLGCNFICTAKIAAYLRAARPSIPILLGGPHATILDRRILECFPQFDVIVRNEAEVTLPAVLQLLDSRKFQDLPGVTFRDGRKVVSNPGGPLIADLDSLPWPAYHSYPIESLNLSTMRVEAGRGCPFSCTFCSTASFFGRKYRLKSPQRICKELDFLHQRYGISHFSLNHDLFTVNRHKVLEFCEEVAGRGYTWSCSARMDCVDSEMLARMQTAGCRSIYYGIETGSPQLQKIVQKHQGLGMFPTILDTTQQLGMRCTLSFITGYPQELADHQVETLNLAGTGFFRNKKLTNIQLHLLTPEPGTQLLHDFGDRLRYDGHISDFNFPTLEPNDAEIMAEIPEIFVNHHYYESALPRWRHIFVTEAFNHLYELDFPVLRALLELYQGKLGLLISGLLSFCPSHNGQAVYSDDLLLRYLAQSLGPGHIMVSLVRYMVAVNRLTNTHAPDGQEVPPKKSTKFKLRPESALLPNSHDCGAALALLTSVKSVDRLPKRIRTERHDYLIIVEFGGERTVRNLVLGEGTAEMIRFFDQPRSRHEFLRRFGPIVENPAAVFRHLQATVLCGATGQNVVASPALGDAHDQSSVLTYS